VQRAAGTGVSAEANSLRRWRQPPQGGHTSSFSATTATALISRSPAATIAPMADASAHWPCG
jgi:hypothetical protein